MITTATHLQACPFRGCCRQVPRRAAVLGNQPVATAFLRREAEQSHARVFRMAVADEYTRVVIQRAFPIHTPAIRCHRLETDGSEGAVKIAAAFRIETHVYIFRIRQRGLRITAVVDIDRRMEHPLFRPVQLPPCIGPQRVAASGQIFRQIHVTGKSIFSQAYLGSQLRFSLLAIQQFHIQEPARIRHRHRALHIPLHPDRLSHRKIRPVQMYEHLLRRIRHLPSCQPRQEQQPKEKQYRTSHVFCKLAKILRFCK